MPVSMLILFRALFSFVMILIMARIMGKKQISQLTFFDYIVGITIGNIAASLAINQQTRILNGIIGLLVWGLLPILLGFLSIRWNGFRLLVEGRPTVLVENGKVLERNLHKTKMTADDLMVNLREKNAFKLADVELALLETNGKVSVMKKSDKQPLTPQSMGMTVEAEHRPAIVVIDGHVLHKSLSDQGYSKEWLLGELMKQGANDFSDVFLAQVDSKGNLYVDLYHDKAQLPQIKQKPLIAAQLKKVQADLENFALQTEDQTAKQMYAQQAKSLQDSIQQLQPYLNG